jgi:hypothetical protein
MSILGLPTRTAMPLAGFAIQFFSRVRFLVANLKMDNRTGVLFFAGLAHGPRPDTFLTRLRGGPSKCSQYS